MWDKYGMISFHKSWESPAVGLAARIAREYGGVLLSRESIIHTICQQTVEGGGFDSPKYNFFFGLRGAHLDDREFPGEDVDEPVGGAKPMEWIDIVSSLSQRLHTTNEALLGTISKEVQVRKTQIEGQGGGSPERR